MKIDLEKINWDKLGFFRFKKDRSGKYLLTTEAAEHIVLSKDQFSRFLEDRLDQDQPLFADLQSKGLIRDRLNLPDLVSKYQKKNLFIWQGPSLHIIVVTLRCNHRCVYCQAASKLETEQGYDLDLTTAKKIVDAVFCSPSRCIAIEFQGGEPLLNWPAVKFIVEYSQEKNKTEKKDLQLRLVSNFSLMDDEKLAFLTDNRVTLCTSLDGPEHLHNKNRFLAAGNSYRQAAKWLKKSRFKDSRPGAIVTISRHSLKHPEKIVDEYVKLGIEALFIRPLTPLGMAKKMWDAIGYPPQDYLSFYKRALERVISYALEHPRSHFHENTAKVFLAKMLTEYDPNYLELRSPCGAGIGQLLYNYDGKVYTCDEGRMVGEDIFCLGRIGRDDYRTVISHPTVRVLGMASCTENSACDFCVYKPYCGICPICNWAECGNIFCGSSASARCIINKGILDLLFSKLEDKKIRALFQKWADYTLPSPE